MREIVVLLLAIPIASFSQKQVNSEDSLLFFSIPYSSNQIVYEKVFYLDSVNDRNKVYNSVKAALIKNTNYKYSKIDEDRNSGSISSEISFPFNAKPGIATLAFDGKCLLIDVRENRFGLD